MNRGLRRPHVIEDLGQSPTGLVKRENRIEKGIGGQVREVMFDVLADVPRLQPFIGEGDYTAEVIADRL